MYHYGLLIVLLNFSPDVRGSVSQGELDRHLELGRDFLAKGQLQDALTQYHAAVDGDPNNYLTYYKRGTVYLALGKPKFALLDLQKVLELKPDFIAARLQRANVLLKQAEFDTAEQDYYDVLKAERDDESNNRRVASFWLDKIDPTKKDYHEALLMIERKKYKDAAELLTSVIEVCPWAPKLRELRAKCYHQLGEYLNAISDIRFTTKLVPGNAAGYFQVSTLLYQLGLVDEALKEIRECLKLDSEHKDCFPAYKKMKKVAKHLNDANNAHEVEESRDLEACVNSAKLVLKFEPDMENVRFTAFHLLCKCNSDLDAAAAIENCQKALKIRKEPTILCDSAEAYLAAEMYDDAIRSLKDALEIDSSFSRAKEMLQKAQQRQKMSESRDYYKILGVRRTASKKEIIKAYRKAAQKWHPDNFPDENEKKRAEKKFIDIASAKEVLTDEEKRAKFDRGEDPLDPESGKHSGFNSFQEFSQFHGSPFQFKFHFN